MKTCKHVEALCCTNQYYPWNVPYIAARLILNWTVVLHNPICCPCTLQTKLFSFWNKLIHIIIIYKNQVVGVELKKDDITSDNNWYNEVSLLYTGMILDWLEHGSDWGFDPHHRWQYTSDPMRYIECDLRYLEISSFKF